MNFPPLVKFMIASICAVLFFSLTASASSPPLLPTKVRDLQIRVKILERKVNSLRTGWVSLNASNASLFGQVRQLQGDLLTAAQAEDGLRVRIERLEKAVFPNG